MYVILCTFFFSSVLYTPTSRRGWGGVGLQCGEERQMRIASCVLTHIPFFLHASLLRNCTFIELLWLRGRKANYECR
jgi:hypothetical protein